jgi:hypothetical protein
MNRTIVSAAALLALALPLPAQRARPAPYRPPVEYRPPRPEYKPPVDYRDPEFRSHRTGLEPGGTHERTLDAPGSKPNIFETDPLALGLRTALTPEQKREQANLVAKGTAFREADAFVTPLRTSVKRNDWSFIKLYSRPSEPVSAEPSFSLFDRYSVTQAVQDLRALERENPSLLPPLPAREAPKGVRIAARRPASTVESEKAAPEKAALIFAPGREQETEVKSLSDVRRSQPKGSRYAIVQGATGPKDLDGISGHVIQVRESVSGPTIERALDTMDRLMASFSHPRNWVQDPEYAKHTVLIARVANEQTAIAVDLAASAAQGRLVSEVAAVSDGSNQGKKQFEAQVTTLLSNWSGERVYLAGDSNTIVDFDKEARKTGVDLVHRNLSFRRSLVATEEGLQQVRERVLDPGSLLVVNGLPSTKEAVRSIGLFAGPAENWLRFHDDVDEATKHVTTPQISTKEAFLYELRAGESDLLILVAHSNGSTVYFNGEEIPLAELEALPKRTGERSRPRVAVLLSCYGDPEPKAVPGWQRWLTSPRVTSSLADILVRKGFVDQVIASKRAIQPRETLSVLREALNGKAVKAIELPPGWITRAVVFRKTTEYPG